MFQKALVRIGELTLFRLFCPQGSEIYDNVDMPSSSPVNGDNAAVAAVQTFWARAARIQKRRKRAAGLGACRLSSGRVFGLSAFAIYSLIPLAV